MKNIKKRRSIDIDPDLDQVLHINAVKAGVSIKVYLETIIRKAGEKAVA